jgi:DNA-nicking Smr family endonuclease
MGRKQRPRAQRKKSSSPKAEKPTFSSPFKELGKMIRQRGENELKNSQKVPDKPASRTIVPAHSSAPPPPAAPLNDEELFLQALDGVRRLDDDRPARAVHKPEVNLEIVSEDAEVLAQLSDLVSGLGNFELTETEEYVEGARLGLDPRLLTRLRRGEFAVQSHIDLHGMIQADARIALEAFILESVRKGLRTVLVVHGRGLGSPGGRPVLKQAASQWLSHGHIGGYVLAFATARPADGGAGAMYVLLRRDRRRARFDVLQGARRRE